MSESGPVKRNITDWVDYMDPQETPLLGSWCVEWKPKRVQPWRGRLYSLVAWALSWWTEQVFSEEFTEGWEARSQEALMDAVCVRWESALQKGKPLGTARLEWGQAPVVSSTEVADAES